jgi:hypothetical protein
MKVSAAASNIGAGAMCADARIIPRLARLALYSAIWA